MVVLPGSRQSQKIALLPLISERTDHELQEIILHHRSISTGSSVAGAIFEADIPTLPDFFWKIAILL